MFEPVEMPKIKVGFTVVEGSAVGDNFYPSDTLNKEVLSTLDLLFVVGGTTGQVSGIQELSDEVGCICAPLNSSFGTTEALVAVANNFLNKFLASEMPNNIDPADVREIKNSSDYLYAFHRFDELFQFLESEQCGEVMGLIYLAHSGTTLQEYEAMNSRFSQAISPYAYFTSSFCSHAEGETSVLIGVRK